MKKSTKQMILSSVFMLLVLSCMMFAALYGNVTHRLGCLERRHKHIQKFYYEQAQELSDARQEVKKLKTERDLLKGIITRKFHE